MEIMKTLGIDLKTIRAGNANMFMSTLFCETLAGISGATIELYQTDGALGAARGAGVGASLYASFDEAFGTLQKEKIIEPTSQEPFLPAYENWKEELEK